MKKLLKPVALFVNMVLLNAGPVDAFADNNSNRACEVVGVPHNQGPIVIKNVNIFNGKQNKLLMDSEVLIDYVRTPDIFTGSGKVVRGADVGYFIVELTSGRPLKTVYDKKMFVL
jgi:hypothetical protein